MANKGKGAVRVMGKWYQGIALSVALMLMMIVVGGCSNDEKTLKVGVSNNPPYVVVTDDQVVNVSGFDIDLMNAIVKKMKMKVVYERTDFVDLFRKINAGEVDAAIAGISITTDRKTEFAFSNSYIDGGDCVVVLNDSILQTFQDLQGKKLGAVNHTTMFKKASTIKDAQVVGFDSDENVSKALENHSVDAVIMDKNNAHFEIYKTNKLNGAKIIYDFDREPFGILLGKYNKELKEEIDRALLELKESGEYQEIYAKWFEKKQ